MSKIGKNNYNKLHQISKTTSILSSIHGLLEWDQETYMPHSAIGIRALQIETIATFIHKHKISPKFSKALAKLVNLDTGEILDDDLTEAQIASVREWRRDYLKAAKLPPSFVKTFAKTTSNAIHAWAKAKKHNNFREFSPHLEKIVNLCRKKADILGFKEHPYDALLDLYEPEMTTAYLVPLFSKLKASLTTLLKAIHTSAEIPRDFLFDHFSNTKQIHLAHQLLQAMGLEQSICRLDQSSHPFCSVIHPKDTRLTTRIHPAYLMTNIFSVIHEGGHGLYNMGLPEEHYGSPLGEQISLGIDESQSRWWETLIGRSLSFWRHFFPILQEHFPEQLSTVYLDDFYRAINVVKPSFIRTDADEITYSLHIIVRFEIEKELIEGSLKVKDLPEAWNSKMREYLGISPTNDGDGCLQDIHWSMGGIGYFPTYTLGNLYASQFFAVFEKDHPSWKEKVSKGELGFIRQWLHEHIYKFGRQYTPQEIVMRISGQPLSEQPFVAYLEKKFKHIYHIS
jgi:carboxypeptidase Taq